MTIELFNNRPDSFFVSAEEPKEQGKRTRAWRYVHTVGTEDGGKPVQFLKRYPPVHTLVPLYHSLRTQTSFPANATMDDETTKKHLGRISLCAGSTINTTNGKRVMVKELDNKRISCNDFFESATAVDQLCIPLLHWIKANKFTTPNPLATPEWMELKDGK